MPEMGRGCLFCDCGEEVEAIPVEGCFKLHETPWLEEYPDNIPTDIFEVRFKNTRRSYYQNTSGLDLRRGDIVAVEASPGHDIGIVSLTGDMVARQMRRVGFNPFNGEYKKIYRKAKPYDIERWQEAIALEHETMIAARQIASDMGLNMKIGDVEYQGDKIKAIFYYIADERVDFRELIKVFADRFRIRIEMKQIGARQEAGRIGGIGACGRELCCASWISNFSSVTTNAARMQELSLNPQKLAGQCSKLKCCLMYEYDVYADARRGMPRVKEPLQTLDGDYHLIKSDPLARTMSFSSSKDAMANVVTIPVSRVKEILALNRAGKKVDSIADKQNEIVDEEPTFRTEEDSIDKFTHTVLSISKTFKKILAFNIPKSRSFMHLDTVFTMVDRDKFTVHPNILSEITVYVMELVDGKVHIREEQGRLEDILKKHLELEQVTLIKCGSDSPIDAAREQWSDGSNTLAIAPGEVVVYERNYVTNRILEDNGITVHTIPCSELSRGRGGPRCMSMPFVRDDVR